MRILFVSSALHKEYGGPPMAVIGASTSLSKLGNNVDLFVFGQSPESVLANNEFYTTVKAQGVQVRTAESWKTRVYGGIGNFQDLFQLYKHIRQAEIVSLHGVYNFQNLIAAIFSLITKTPYTLMPHGTLTKYQRSKHFKRKFLVDPIFYGFLLRGGDRIFVATEIEKEEISNSLKSKTDVVGLGINIPDNSGKKIEEKLSKNTFNFLFMGRIAPKKRLDLAIEAFNNLPYEIQNESKFVICGSGDDDYVNAIKAKAQELSITSRVEFRGWVAAGEKSEVLNNSDCFLLTSEDENFAIAAGEALANGIPCILSNKVALSNVVEKYGAGKVFSNLDSAEISDAMIEIFKSNSANLKSKAKKASSELSWEFVAKNWDLALKKIVRNYQ
jgi:glycosyltransferase involved in cell wall biosynthesis